MPLFNPQVYPSWVIPGFPQAMSWPGPHVMTSLPSSPIPFHKPYSENRIIYRVKSTFRKKYLFTRSLCGITKIPFGSPKQTEPTGNGKGPPGAPGNVLRSAGRHNKQKKGVPGASRSTGTPTLNAAACYSPTPSRVQYHRRDQALASGFGKGPGVSPGP